MRAAEGDKIEERSALPAVIIINREMKMKMRVRGVSSLQVDFDKSLASRLARVR